MATMTIRGTYALDVESVRKLEQLAKKWGVSKSEALRRSIHSAASNHSKFATVCKHFELCSTPLH